MKYTSSGNKVTMWGGVAQSLGAVAETVKDRYWERDGKGEGQGERERERKERVEGAEDIPGSTVDVPRDETN